MHVMAKSWPLSLVVCLATVAQAEPQILVSGRSGQFLRYSWTGTLLESRAIPSGGDTAPARDLAAVDHRVAFYNGVSKPALPVPEA